MALNKQTLKGMPSCVQRLTPKQRAQQDMGVTSPAVMEAMRREDVLVRQMALSKPPGRGKVKIAGPDYLIENS